MKRSKRSSDLLDLEKDLKTTSADVAALRMLRPTFPAGDLSEANRLRAPFDTDEDRVTRKVLSDLPPFEL